MRTKPPTTQPRRAAVYCRVSSAGQEDNSSLATQEAACRAYAEERGWTVVAVHREVHTGAELFERPELTRLREGMRRGDFDVLLVHALDRLSRKQTHQGLVLSEAEHAGVAWHSATEDIDDSPQGQILRAVIGGMAEMERLKIAERTQRGKAARVASGKPNVGAKPPYGLRWIDERDKVRLEADPDTSSVLRRIFTELAAGGSARQLSLALTREGVPTPTNRGTHWHWSTIRAIVGNPIYSGDAHAYRWKATKTQGRRTQVLRPTEEQTVVNDVAPVLVSPEVVHAARARLAVNKKLATRNNQNPEAALLRGGYALCGYCGGTMQVNNHRSGTLYRCETSNRDKFGCPHHCIMAAVLDTAAWQRVEAVLTRPAVVAAEVARLRRDDPTHADRCSLDRRLTEAERQRANAARLAARFDDDEAAAPFLVEIEALTNQMRALREERERLEAQRAGWEEAQGRLDDLTDWCRVQSANLSTLTYLDRRLAIEALGVEARVWATDHTPRYEIILNLDVLDQRGASGPRSASGDDRVEARVDGYIRRGCARPAGCRAGPP